MPSICAKIKIIMLISLCSLSGMSLPVSAGKGDTLSVSIEGSRLRSQPSTKSVILKRLQKGEKLTEQERTDKWVKVITSRARTSGWIFHQNVVISARVNEPKVITEPKRIDQPRAITDKGANLSGPVLRLSDLGYKDGILFEGSAANHARKLYFQVPQDVAMQRGLLRLHYRFSPLLEKHSNMRIYVNGAPRKTVRLGGDSSGGWIDIALGKLDLQKRFVEVEVRSAMLLSEDRCFDERIGGAYLQVLPDTTLQWQLGGDIASIRTFWQLLPPKVTVSLPAGELDENLFANALGLTQSLMRSGRKVNFSRLPEMGDIVIASTDQLTRWIGAHYHASAVDRYQSAADKKNLTLVTLTDKQFLAVTGRHDSHSLSFLSNTWKDLALGNAYQVQPGIVKGVLSEDNYALPLGDLGMNTDVVEMTTQASWSASINPSHLPPGHRLDKVRIQMITAPSMSDKPVMFYSYLNGVLIKAVRMADTGRSDEIVLSLPEHLLSRVNNLHFVARRDLSDGDSNCMGEPMQFPIQVKPDSTIETRVDDTLPENFAHLPAYLSAGYEAYLPKTYLAQAEKLLSYLATLMTDMDLPTQVGALHFYTPEEVITPAAPFLLFGKANVALNKQGVHFDKGRIDVMNQSGEVLLAVDALPKLSIAQLVRAASTYGLWVVPPDPAQLTPVKDIHLSKDDVAFIDHNGILMTLDSSQPGLSRIDYPDSTGWFELFGEYRFWYFAVGWLLLTSLIVYLYRLSRSHRKN